jgi:type II secretory pathway pseudopilin PulG
MHKKSFTLLEVLVSAIILVTTLAGLLATFVAVRKAVLRSGRRLTAFNVGRRVLEDLYKEVDGSSWDSGRLNATYTENGTLSIPPENIAYNWNYTVTNMSASGYDYRQVSVRVTYPEP